MKIHILCQTLLLFNIYILWYCFISEDCVYRITPKRRRASIPILGVASSNAGTTKGIVNVIITPSHDVNCEIPLDALVLKRITNYEPSSLLSINDFPQFQNIQLADEHCLEPGKIDVHLGADMYCEIMQDGFIRGKNGNVIAQKIILGGIRSNKSYNNINIQSMHVNLNIEHALKKFWK